MPGKNWQDPNPQHSVTKNTSIESTFVDNIRLAVAKRIRDKNAWVYNVVFTLSKHFSLLMNDLIPEK